MAFKKRTLSSLRNEQQRDFEQARKKFNGARRSRFKYYILIPLILIATFFIFRALSWGYEKISDFSFTDLVWGLTSDIDIDDNHTTILLLGHAGGEHDGPDLTDTIIVATIDHRLGTVSLLSLPRDLFVSVSGYEPARINSIWKLGQMRNEDNNDGYYLLRTVVESIIDEPIHYHARINFDGFEKVIDAVGGVYVDVEAPFTDYQYPTKNFGWQTISFSEGTQLMDGERALQFARSRHGNNEQGSDFQRALRQQKIIMALRNKVLSAGVLTSPGKLQELYSAINSMIETDIDISEVLALAKFGSDIDREDVRSFSLTDGLDGFLYTPSDEERHMYYNGWFVLLPLGNNWDTIQDFIDIIWHHGELYQENAKIAILNGTGTPRLAQSCMSHLKRYHLNPVETKNASQDYGRTVIYDHTMNTNPKTLKILEKLTGGKVVSTTEETAPTTADISLILGNDTTCRTW